MWQTSVSWQATGSGPAGSNDDHEPLQPPTGNFDTDIENLENQIESLKNKAANAGVVFPESDVNEMLASIKQKDDA